MPSTVHAGGSVISAARGSSVVGSRIGAGSTLPSVLTPKQTQLRTALIQRLKKKYKTPVPNSSTDKAIEDGVDKLLQLPTVTQRDLEQLEEKIRHVSNGEVQDVLLQPFKNIAARKQGLHDEWGDMFVYVKRKTEEDAVNKARKKEEEKNKYRSGLDRQIREKEAQKKAASKEFVEDTKHMKTLVNKFREEESVKIKKKYDTFAQERKEREAEMAEFRERREKEKLRKKEEELEELARLRRTMEEAAVKAYKNKQATAEKLNKWKEENEKNRAIKEKELERKKQEERLFAKKAMQQLEKQERERVEALVALKNKMKGKEALALEQGKKMEEQAKEDERKAFEIQQAAARKAEDEFRAAQRKKEVKKRELQKDLAEQLAIHERRKAKEKIEEEKFGEEFKRQYVKDFEKDLIKVQKAKEKELKHRKELEDQIRMRVFERGRAELVLTDTERKLNKQYFS